MPKQHHDPMLRKMISPKQREEELRLLKEYELAGKITRLDYVAPEIELDDEIPDKETTVEGVNLFVFGTKENLGNGNFQCFKLKE